MYEINSLLSSYTICLFNKCLLRLTYYATYTIPGIMLGPEQSCVLLLEK